MAKSTKTSRRNSVRKATSTSAKGKPSSRRSASSRISGSGRPAKKPTASPLMVRLDEETKSYLTRAAELRRISVSDYVRTVTVGQARREVEAARDQTIVLTPDEQLAFWNALHAPVRLTEAQKRLGAQMRGEF